MGSRPSYHSIPGAQDCCLTSDDIFSIRPLEGAILVIGGSYIALECAGFLHSIGKDVTLMNRSLFLRGFDREMAEVVVNYMERSGLKIIRAAQPVAFEKADSAVKVVFEQEGTTHISIYQHVLLAIGRHAVTSTLNLESVGVQMNPSNGKIRINAHNQTSVESIWAVGDASDNPWELTPVAIKAGIYLSQRLFAGKERTVDYGLVPTTVFTPLEYACVGLSEESAVSLYGFANIQVYISSFTPLEWTFSEKRRSQQAHVKLICLITQAERVIGVHYAGPNAGEVIQGYVVALSAGATKAIIDSTVGIHPTCAEELLFMQVTKRLEAEKA